MPDSQEQNQGAAASGASGNPSPPASNGDTPPALTQADIDKAVSAALAERDNHHAQQFKEATGFDSLDAFSKNKLEQEGKLKELADANAQEAATYKQRYQQQSIQSALLAASAEAVDSEIIVSLLAGKASVDDAGKVTVDGKDAQTAVAELLKAKPHLAKASGNQGSGAGNSQSGSNQLSLDEFNRLPNEKRFAFIRDGGKVI